MAQDRAPDRAPDRHDDEPGTGERRRIPSGRELSLRAELIQVRHELKTLLDDLSRVAAAVESPVQSAVVMSVVSRTTLIPHIRVR